MVGSKNEFSLTKLNKFRTKHVYLPTLLIYSFICKSLWFKCLKNLGTTRNFLIFWILIPVRLFLHFQSVSSVCEEPLAQPDQPLHPEGGGGAP
jgi:hypothetical protein